MKTLQKKWFFSRLNITLFWRLKLREYIGFWKVLYDNDTMYDMKIFYNLSKS